MSELVEDRLLKAILTLLTPVFLPFASDIASAQDAALATIERMRLDPQADLLSIAQAIAFGVASIQTLVHALKPDLDPALLLRLTRCANSLSRIEARHRRIVNAPAGRRPPPHRPTIRERTAVGGETDTQPTAADKPDAAEAPVRPPSEARPAPSPPAVQPKTVAAKPAIPSPPIAARPSLGNLSEKALDDLLNWTANVIDGKKDNPRAPNFAVPAREAKGIPRRSGLMSSVAHHPLLNAASPPGKALKG